MVSSGVQRKIEKLYATISKSNQNVHKTNHTRYIRWLNSHGLVSVPASSSSSPSSPSSGTRRLRSRRKTNSRSVDDDHGNRDSDSDSDYEDTNSSSDDNDNDDGIGAFTVSDFMKDLPLSPQLVHWFLLEKVILDSSIIGQKLALLKQYVESFKFLRKIRTLYRKYGEEETEKEDEGGRGKNKGSSVGSDLKEKDALFERYLSRVINVHTSWQTLLDTYSETKLGNPILPNYFIVSINVWNSNIKKLSMRTSYERFRFLADFHIATYTKLTFQQRSKMKLNNLVVNDPNLLIINYEYFDESSDSFQLVNLLPQDCPFLCPFTTLAAYFYFRFYGVPNRTSGDGFPDLLDKKSAGSLPLVKGRQATEYLSDGSLHMAYMKMFKYCNVPYKRRTYFEYPKPHDDCTLECNRGDIEDFFTKFCQLYPNADVTPVESGLFDDKVPMDFERILNHRDPYSIDDHAGITGVDEYFKRRRQRRPPESVLVHFFPEIEFYRKQVNFEKLTPDAKNVLNLLQTLRLVFVGNLPTIYKVFPDHPLFKYRLYTNSDVKSYLRKSLASESITNRLLPLIQFQNLTVSDFYKQLVEPPPNAESLIASSPAPGMVHSVDSSMPPMSPGGVTPQTNALVPVNDLRQLKRRRMQVKAESMALTTGTTAPYSEPQSPPQVSTAVLSEDQISDLRRQNFKYIQFQTLSNFRALISFLHRVFSEIKMENSERIKVMRQLESLSDSMLTQITSTTPQDVKEYFIKNKGMLNGNKGDNLEDSDRDDSQSKSRGFKWGVIHESSDDMEEAEVEGAKESSRQDEEGKIQRNGENLKQRKKRRKEKERRKRKMRKTGEGGGSAFKLGSILQSSEGENDVSESSDTSSSSVAESENGSGDESGSGSGSESDTEVSDNGMETKPKEAHDSRTDQDLNALSSLQEELKVLVDEFVSAKVDTIISRELERYETKLDGLVDSLVSEKVQTILKRELASERGSLTKGAKTLHMSLDNSLDDTLNVDEAELSQSGRLAPSTTIVRKIKEAGVREREGSEIGGLIHSDQPLTVRKPQIMSTPMESRQPLTPEKNKAETSFHSQFTTESAPALGSHGKFELDPSIDSVESVILEWFTPNPLMNNESVQTMNKKYGRSWRFGFETLYKQRKLIVELYVYLVNKERLDRYRALEVCNTLRQDKSIREFSKSLKAWKRRHNDDFEGILEEHGINNT